MISKRCEVCGGNVTPVDDRSPFGSCESCGIVYALKDKMQGSRNLEAQESVEKWPHEEPTEINDQAGTQTVDAAPAETSGSRWRCPDCGTLLISDNESDL